MARVEHASDAGVVYFEEQDVCAQYKVRRAAVPLELDGQAGEGREAKGSCLGRVHWGRTRGCPGCVRAWRGWA